MKIFLISMIFLHLLLNGTKANTNGQTNQIVPLLNDSGSPTGTTISCYPFSVEDNTNEVEYFKYVLDTEEEDSSTVNWIPQPDKTLFEQCASYAAEQNAGMFYFDGETCETSHSVYERKVKDCNYTAAKMVYMQKDFQPEPIEPDCMDGSNGYFEGQVWDADLECGVRGRKNCSDGVITAERKLDIESENIYISHTRWKDYMPITGGCLIKPQESNKRLNPEVLAEICSDMSAVPCDPPSEISNGSFEGSLRNYLSSITLKKLNIDKLVINAFKNATNNWNWNDSPSTPTNFPKAEYDWQNCMLATNASHLSEKFVADDCDSLGTCQICCMLKG